MANAAPIRAKMNNREKNFILIGDVVVWKLG
jgi:hypothetical protein